MNKQKIDNDVLLNMDGEFICNTDTGEFGMSFSDEQKKMIIRLIDKNSHCPIEAIGYHHLSAKQMGLIYILLYKDNPNMDNIRPVDVWKITHMGLDDDQLYWTCIALRHGVYIADNSEYVRNIDQVYIENIAIAAALGKDFSPRLTAGITDEQLWTLHNEIGEVLENTSSIDDDYECYLIRDADEVMEKWNMLI